MLKPFDFKGLTELDDGRIAKAIDVGIAHIYEDLDDRANNSKARTLTLQITLVPTADDKGRLDEVDVECRVVERVPARTSKVYRMSAQHGALLYNELSPEDPGQRTLDEQSRPAAPTGLRKVGG